MDEKQREGLALFRHSVIGSLISGELCHGDLKRRVRELSGQRYSIPFSHRTHIGQGTIMEWLSVYRTSGFDALKPRKRSSAGKHPSMRKELAEELVAIKKRQPKIAVLTMFRMLREQSKMKHNEVSAATAYRYLAHAGLMQRLSTKTGNEQRRFSHQFPNDCWQGDVMHGPYIKDAITAGAPARKTYLAAFIDDASRLIVGAQFFFSEATVNIKTVLRNAVMTYGVPRKLYLDNGKNFCADDIRIACASMKCALIHTTPYYPEGKGKIERFFRTVRSMFLPCLRRVNSLQELNQCFDAWLQNEYNRRPHDGIGGAQPLNTYLRSADSRIRSLPAHVDPVDLFCLKETRLVAKDGTFRINNILYETQEHLIGRSVTIHYDRDEPTHKVKVFDGDVFAHEALPIDFLANAKAKRRPLLPDSNNNPVQPLPF
jgi:transposase InsO family protein